MIYYTTKSGLIIAGEPEPQPAKQVYTVDVTIRDTITGETAVESQDYPGDYPLHTVEFLWTDGNFGCDCNRGIFVHGEDWDSQCGSGRFVIDLAVVRQTGEVLCDKGEWDA